MALSNSQYDAIMRVYNQRQFQDKREQDKRIAEVYEKVPQVEALSDEIAATMAQAARKILAGNRTAADQLKKDAEFLKEQKAVYLKQNGYPTNYLGGPSSPSRPAMHRRLQDCSSCASYSVSAKVRMPVPATERLLNTSRVSFVLHLRQASFPRTTLEAPLHRSSSYRSSSGSDGEECSRH